MRSIKDDFQSIAGSPVFYTPVLRGPEWKRQGLPRIGPVDRMVWHYLRAIDSVKRPTVAEIARQVWHPDGNYRNSAKASLDRLKKIGLADFDEKRRWFSIIPDLKCAQISAHLEEKPSAQISTKNAQISADCAQISAPQENNQGAQISADEVRRLARPSAQISADRCADLHTIEKREERRKEKLASTREDSENSNFENRVDLDDWLEDDDGVDIVSALKSHPAVFSKGFPIPESLAALEIYFEMAVQAELEYRRLIGKPVVKATFIGSLIYEEFRAEPIKAQDSLKACIGKLKEIRDERAKQAQSTEAVEKVKRLTTIPPWDEKLDALGVEVRPWLKSRFQELSARLSAIEASDSEDLQYPRKKVEALWDRFEAMWRRAGCKNKNQAIDVRRQLFQAASILDKNLKSEGVTA